jgi:hypothetical protein
MLNLTFSLMTNDSDADLVSEDGPNEDWSHENRDSDWATNKQGFKHKPKTVVEVGLLVVEQLKALNETMRGVYDIMRSAVRTQVLCLRHATKTHANYMYCSTVWLPSILLRLRRRQVVVRMTMFPRMLPKRLRSHCIWPAAVYSDEYV